MVLCSHCTFCRWSVNVDSTWFVWRQTHLEQTKNCCTFTTQKENLHPENWAGQAEHRLSALNRQVTCRALHRLVTSIRQWQHTGLGWQRRLWLCGPHEARSLMSFLMLLLQPSLSSYFWTLPLPTGAGGGAMGQSLSGDQTFPTGGGGTCWALSTSHLRHSASTPFSFYGALLSHTHRTGLC